jgi:predicted small secreted protein
LHHIDLQPCTFEVKRIVVLLFVTAFLATVGVGCNAAHGFGKDVESAGESIQDGTK